VLTINRPSDRPQELQPALSSDTSLVELHCIMARWVFRRKLSEIWWGLLGPP
jgi:hypothetical protein